MIHTMTQNILGLSAVKTAVTSNMSIETEQILLSTLTVSSVSPLSHKTGLDCKGKLNQDF